MIISSAEKSNNTKEGSVKWEMKSLDNLLIYSNNYNIIDKIKLKHVIVVIREWVNLYNNVIDIRNFLTI